METIAKRKFNVLEVESGMKPMNNASVLKENSGMALRAWSNPTVVVIKGGTQRPMSVNVQALSIGMVTHVYSV